MWDSGDSVPLAVSVYDNSTPPVLADATAVTLTVTLPDGSTSTPAVTHASTGVYTATGPSTLAGRYTVRWVATGVNASAFTDAYDVDDVAPTGLVSLADVKAHLSITSTTNDEKLRRFIDAATDFVESITGPVVRRTVTQTVYPSAGMLPLNGPAISLTSVTGARGYPGVYDTATMYLENDIVYLAPYSTTFCYPVTVTYVGGRAVVPALIQQAALDYIEWLWQDQRGPSGQPFQAADEYPATTPATVPFKILQALEPYRMQGFA